MRQRVHRGRELWSKSFLGGLGIQFNPLLIAYQSHR